MTNAEIEAAHTRGAKQYGGSWLTANSSAANIIALAGLQPHKQKHLGLLIAFRLCQWFEEGCKQAQKATE